MEESAQIDRTVVKKPRMSDTNDNGEDIISNSPESVICRILSLLPTKDALRTCVLSKDWEYKWTSIDNIDINDRIRFFLKTTRKKSVVSFVDRIFILSHGLRLKKFHLSCQQEYDASRIMTWISAALMRNVEDLEIVYDYGGVVLPRCLFDCIPLTRLKLQLPCVFRPVQNWFSDLKVLRLGKVEIRNDHAPSNSPLIFNFPVLETLELRDCKWLKVNFLEVKAPALTELKVIHYSGLPEVENCYIKISGAKLLKISYHRCFVENFDLSASLVFSAAIGYQSSAHDLQVIRKNGLQARLLLKGCSGLNHLQLSGDTVEAITQSKQGTPLPKFNMLKRLEISTKCNSEAFLEFLHSTPYLQWIKLNMWMWNDYDYDLVESMPSCIVSHLKEVEFCGFKGEKPHVHLADFLLKHATELKKMSGLSRKKSDERRAEKNFWSRLKGVVRDFDFEVGFLDKKYGRFFGS